MRRNVRHVAGGDALFRDVIRRSFPTRYLFRMMLQISYRLRNPFVTVSLILVPIVVGCSQPESRRPSRSPSAHPDTVTAGLLPSEPSPPGADGEFTTDFSRHTVPYSEIISGGPGRDGIPALDRPRFVAVNQASSWLKPQEPVVVLKIGTDVRAYPIQILMWHELVNDTVGGLPVAVSFCPLCNTAIAFDRRYDGRVLEFGTTGRLHYSNLVMYDRQSESWWQQATGEAIAGRYAGGSLTFLPASMISWGEFMRAYPSGMVLSRETGYLRDYGDNPYLGYDDIAASPFLYHGPDVPGQLRPMERVLTVELNGESVAYPYQLLEQQRVVDDVVGGRPIVVIWEPGTASALDTWKIGTGRDVGSAVAFERTLDGGALNFRLDGDAIRDDRGGAWSLQGMNLREDSSDRALSPVVGVNHFWFSWSVFRPKTRVYAP